MAWLSGWSYRRKITITNNSSNDLTDYQVAIDLDSSNFDFSKANSDGSDIRFTDSDGETLLSYWIESWDSANSKAKIWVKVPSIPASGSVDIYMYYGNSSATDEGNPEQVFDFFDHFDNTNKWTKIDTDITVSCENSIMTLKMVGTAGDIRTKDKWPSQNIILEVYAKHSADDTVYHKIAYMTDQADGSDYNSFGYVSNQYWNHEYIQSYSNGTGGRYEFASDICDQSQWHIYAASIKPSEVAVWLDGVKKATRTTNIPDTETMYILLQTPNYQYKNALFMIDWVRIRKFADPEPSYIIGSEETPTVGYTKTLTESLGLSDSMTKSATHSLSENLALSDIYSRTWTANRIYTESLNLADAIRKSAFKRLNESMTLTDIFNRIWNANRVYSESLSLNDAISRVVDKSLSESLSLFDIYTRVWTANRPLYDSLNLKDSITKSPSIKKGEILELVDTISALRTLLQTLAEVLTLSDKITKNPNILKVEDIGLLDTHTKTTYKTHTESLAFQDTLQKEADKAFVEILGVSDTISRDAMISLEEVLQILDTIAKSPSLSLSEILGLRDFVIKGISKTFAEELALYDSISTIKALIKILTEELVLKDTFSRVFNIQKNLAETLTLQDKISKEIDLHTLSEIINLYDYTKYGMNVTKLAKLIRKLIQLEDLGGGWHEFR